MKNFRLPTPLMDRWAGLPEVLQQLIVSQLIVGNDLGARLLPLVAILDRCRNQMVQGHLDNLNKLRQPPFQISAEEILGGMTKLLVPSGNLQPHHMQVLGAALASGALPGLKYLGLSRNQISDNCMKVFADAVSKGGLASLKRQGVETGRANER